MSVFQWVSMKITLETIYINFLPKTDTNSVQRFAVRALMNCVLSSVLKVSDGLALYHIQVGEKRERKEKNISKDVRRSIEDEGKWVFKGVCRCYSKCPNA